MIPLLEDTSQNPANILPASFMISFRSHQSRNWQKRSDRWFTVAGRSCAISFVAQPLEILWLQACHVPLRAENSKTGLEPAGVNLLVVGLRVGSSSFQNSAQALPVDGAFLPDQLFRRSAVWKMGGVVERC